MTTSLSRRHLMGIGGLSLLALPAAAACSSSSSSGGDKKSLTFMVLGANQKLNDFLSKTAIPEFKKKTGIDVTVQNSDWGSAFQKVTTAAASRQIADVLLLGAIWTAPLASKGALLPLDDYKSKLSNFDALFPEMLADGVWEDKQYSVPIGGDVRDVVYRKDLLEKAGVDVSNLPTTWEELKTVAVKVRDAGVCQSPIWFSLDKSIGLQQAFALLTFQNGGEYWTADGKANFSSAPIKEALSYLVDAFNEGLSDYHLILAANQPRPIVSGASAISFGGSMADYSDADTNDPSIKDQLIVGPAIKGPSGKEPASGAWINKLAVAKASKNPEGAVEFINFMLESSNMSQWDQYAGYLPVRKDLTEEEWLGEPGKALMALAGSAKSQPPHPGMMGFGQDINELLQSAVRGSASVEETLAAIDAKLNSFKG